MSLRHRINSTSSTHPVSLISSGLDPAGPSFSGRDIKNGIKKKKKKNGINPTSAKFVDVIHTDGAGIISYHGVMERRGHADFYPNGGRDQPGCYFGRRKRAITPAALQQRKW